VKNPKDDAELEKLCREWQARLYLRDWDISIAYLPEEKMDDAQGVCDPYPKLRRASIGILRLEDYPAEAAPQDVEQTLVHELLHCYPHAARPGSVAEMFEEQGIEAAAKALVALKRARKR
jgi:hypothetical protein